MEAQGRLAENTGWNQNLGNKEIRCWLTCAILDEASPEVVPQAG